VGKLPRSGHLQDKEEGGITLRWNSGRQVVRWMEVTQDMSIGRCLVLVMLNLWDLLPQN